MLPNAGPVCTCAGMLPRDPDADKTIEELIVGRGYPVESHKAVTRDGYVLGLQRISRGKGEPADRYKRSRPAVLLVHGLCGSAITWVSNYDSQSLGFVLANAGYDVWLGNLRGCSLSRKHVTLNPDRDIAFWNFTFQEMIEHDVPLMIDYVLEKTGRTQLGYVGHSQGTLVMFGLLSSNAVYNKKPFQKKKKKKKKRKTIFQQAVLQCLLTGQQLKALSA
ncbi:gastric triacylglycerol lipase-like [Haemaphysalis longicornis]